MQLKGKISFKGGVSMRVKHSFSKQHYSAAKCFSNEAIQIESSSTSISEEDLSKHRAYVTGTIFFAVAALEASINEFYLEALDRNENTLSGLNNNQLSILSCKWENIESLPVDEKYQEALKSLGKKEFDKGRNPFQDTVSLIDLRNALVHYKPEWDDETDVHKKIKIRLHKKFPINTFSKPKNLWFPHQCLGAGCAIWSINTIESFMSEFCKAMGIINRFK